MEQTGRNEKAKSDAHPQKGDRSLGKVEASKLHASTVLPKRDIDPKHVETIKKDGVQQPIIVRPSQVEKGMYEIIDGHTRHESLEKNQEVPVDVRRNVDDSEVFRISEATFKRKARTTYERALFYSNWAKALESKRDGQGVQARLAEAADLSEAEISNYVSIGRLFEDLDKLDKSGANFNSLKTQPINKLCQLARAEGESVMLDAAQKLVQAPKMPLEELKSLINELELSNDPICRLEEDDEDRQEAESSRINELQQSSQNLEKAINETNKTFSSLKTSLAVNPRAYSSWTIVHKLERILNALKRIEQQTKSVIDSAKES